MPAGQVRLAATPPDLTLWLANRTAVRGRPEPAIERFQTAILAHYHPSGSGERSRADEFLTQTPKTALALVDVRVLDHLVVAGADVCSFAERGLV